MTRKIWKIRDTSTGKYWNGNPRCVSFGPVGFSWKRREQAESRLAYYMAWKDAWSEKSSSSNNLPAMDNWEIVEIELKEIETGTHKLDDFIKFQKLRIKASNEDNSFGYFLEAMWNKGVVDKIEFLIKLKPSDGQRWVNMERTKECRAHLRQLGVKTRTFRERHGIFGMMDRQQALKARMVLDVEKMLDLGEIRKEIK